MGFLDELKRLTKPYDEDDDYEDFTPKASEKIPVTSQKNYSQSGVKSRMPSFVEDSGSEKNKVVNIHATTQLSVVLVRPERFEAAVEIADHLREKRTVVMNLESTNKDVARRLLDFVSGVAYAQEGKVKKIAVSTYLVTPYDVDLLGDLLDELENNGLYL